MGVDDLPSSEMQEVVCNWKWDIKEKFILILVLYILAIYTELDVLSEICSVFISSTRIQPPSSLWGFLALKLFSQHILSSACLC